MSLHTRYRPKTFDKVLGQDAAVRSLKANLKKGVQTFLLTGPSGVGKTTLARIAAREAGCSKATIHELDAATYTGVDNMREIKQLVQYKPFGDTERVAVILDECHRLSKQAWESLLKIIEEPPAHLLWFLCTTEPAKIMTTIKTRCVSLNLKSVPEKTLGKLYDRVVKAEGIELPGDIGDLIIKEAGGSPRQMLVNLALCTDAKTKAEAAALLQSAQASDPTIKLARYLCFERRKDWAGAMKIVAEFTDESPEGVRIVICNYVAACLKNPKVAKPEWLLHILEMFSEPYREYEKMGPLMLSIGRVLYA